MQFAFNGSGATYLVSNTPARFSEGRRPEENLAGVLDTNTMAKDLFLATQKIWNI